MIQKIIIFNFLFFCILSNFNLHGRNTLNIQRCFWANYHHFKGNQQEATQWFSRLFSANVPHICHAPYIHFLFNAKRFSEIYNLKNIIQEEFSTDISLQLLLAQVLSLYGQEHTMHEHLIDLNKKYPEHPELTLYTIQIFSTKKEYEKALTCLNNLLNKSKRVPSIFLFHFAKAQLYLQLNNFSEALYAAEEARELFPHFDKTWLMLGLLYEQMGDTEEAVTAYKKYLTLTTFPLKEFEQKIMLLSLQQNLLSTSIEKKTKTIPELLHISKDLYEKKAYSEALRHLNMLLKYDNCREAKLLKIDILLAQNRYISAINYMENLIHDESINKQGENIYLIEKLHKIALGYNCISTSIKALKKSLQEKERIDIYVYLADLCLRAEEYTAATRYLEEAKNHTTDVSQHNAICFQLALLYHSQHVIPKMKTVLKDAIKKDNSCDYIANAYAYYHGKYEKNFDIALEYINKALSISPENPHYLDTQAFILYKKGDIEKAEKILENIIEKNQQDPFIALHYAKVLLKQKKYSATEKLLQNMNQKSFPENFLAKAKKIQNELSNLCY